MNRTLTLLKRHFWWPSMYIDTRAFVSAFMICAWGKSSHRPPSGLHPLPVPSRPLSHVALDFVMSLCLHKVTVILTIVDRFSKAVNFVALPNFPSASETADLLVRHVVRLYGILLDIVSDWGPQFLSQVWRAFCQAGATVSLSSGFYPQFNGQMERANKDLEVTLRCGALLFPGLNTFTTPSPALPQVPASLCGGQLSPCWPSPDPGPELPTRSEGLALY